MDGSCCAAVDLQGKSVDRNRTSFLTSLYLARLLHLASHVVEFEYQPSQAAGMTVLYQPRVVHRPAARAPPRQADMGQLSLRKVRPETQWDEGAGQARERRRSVRGDRLLVQAYLATKDAERNIRLFDELLPDYAWFTPVKKVDFLLWSER